MGLRRYPGHVRRGPRPQRGRRVSAATTAIRERGALRLVASYPPVVATLVVGVLGIILLSTGYAPVTSWLVSGYSLLVALMQAVGMVRDLLRGHVGIDVLAISAIVATVVVGEYW